MNKFELDHQMKAIIKACQQDFIIDAENRLKEMFENIQLWKLQKINDLEVVEIIHKHTHALKGIALSIHFDLFHHVCENILMMIKKEEDRIWNQQEILSLISETLKLENALEDCRLIARKEIE